MTVKTRFEIFLATAPGLEPVLCEEARAAGFQKPKAVPGGVTFEGGWPHVWRANLEIRGASRILARIDSFHVQYLAQLDKRARQVPWASVLKRDVPVRVEATCRKSKIYHSGAAAERIENAIRSELGATISQEAPISIRARIDDDECTIAVDTSGELLHRRGFKTAVNEAPLRENLAALFLRQCGYTGKEPVLDPMCGSGTFVIEAAEIALGLKPGRSRHFAFEDLATFDADGWEQVRSKPAPARDLQPSLRFCGSDRDGNAIEMSKANAERAGVAHLTNFDKRTISELTAPEGMPGLVIVNPPYGERLGSKDPLFKLYKALGQVLRDRFRGWRAGIITSEPSLANATGLKFTLRSPPIPHGGLRIALYATDTL